MMVSYFVGVDVGTSSVRAALVDNEGFVVKKATDDISIRTPEPGYYEQSSAEIWMAVLKCVGIVTSAVDRDDVKGIGFDATCSLVVLDADFQPVSISKDDAAFDIIMWQDHRAAKEAGIITSKQHGLLRHVGGKISLEMQPPKLLWLKQNLPHSWHKAANLFDLPDFLTWKATGSLQRSACSVVCKWLYDLSNTHSCWDPTFFTDIGLSELCKNNFSTVGSSVLFPGQASSSSRDANNGGLTEAVAHEMGLATGTAVSASMIDAHAGGLGCIMSHPESDKVIAAENTFSTDNKAGSSGNQQHKARLVGLNSTDVTERLVMIAGTSTCHMTLSKYPLFVPGVWGPYYSAMVPGFWLNEAGQSVAGKLIDHVVSTHPAFPELQSISKSQGLSWYEVLNNHILSLCASQGLHTYCELTKDIHIYPDFHGNRSPIADPGLVGMISGLTLSRDLDNLAILYLGTVQSLAYSTQHIICSLRSQGQHVKVIVICGGLQRNSVYVKMHADCLGLPVLVPWQEDSVLVGAAMLGATAAGYYKSLTEAMCTMSGEAMVHFPDERDADYHDKKYKVFVRMLEDQLQYRKIMCT